MMLQKRYRSKQKQFNELRTEEAENKFRSILYLALGNEEKRIFGQKFTRVQIVQTCCEEFWENLETIFVRKTNVTFKKHKILNKR